MALPSTNMNLNLYRVFYTVAKTKSFSESSRTLHISQPAISKHIQNLEYELKTILFYRTNRGIELTPEAKKLLVYIEKAYNYLMIGERELEENNESKECTISLGVPTYISIYYLNKYLKIFLERHPNISIKIINNDEITLLDLFKQHSIDILITLNDIKEDKELQKVEFMKEEFCFAYSKEKTGYDSITSIEELINQPLLLPSKNNNTRKKLDDYFLLSGITINPTMELDAIEMIVNYTKEGLGIGYLPKRIVERDDDLEEILLSNPLPFENINIIYNESVQTSITREFISLLNNEK